MQKNSRVLCWFGSKGAPLKSRWGFVLEEMVWLQMILPRNVFGR
ncbi:hypothetical protein BVRB_016870 [Beta vulgaris subsp. vulgaris]|uniref:Uncharacterized protein n=1 Tax=Beta vulgaris subsp. vulgaris TaxID=3555 RepID=A0A0J8B0V6_BETVV|nr:hypothetical protein BVRB_016870 [Beta vulgaris subsp. vulgaris]